MTEPNPIAVKIFGPPPEGLDLSMSTTRTDTAAVIALLAIATASVMLRFVARAVQGSGVKHDDWIIVLALGFVAGTVAMSIVGGKFGAGRHVWVIELENLTMIFKILYGYTFIYAAACAVTKISILLFYVRVFPMSDFLFRMSIFFGFFLSISYPGIIWITMANCCKPVSFYWMQFSGAKGKCININKFYLALGIINMIADVIVLVIPIPQILRLQMSMRKKAAVCGIMLLGSFVCVASIVRIFYLSRFTAAVDVTYMMGPVFIWSAIEPSIGIVSACLPHLAPLRQVIQKKISSSLGSKTGNSNSNTPWRSHTSAAAGGSQKTNPLFTYGGSRFGFGNEGIQKLSDEDEIGLTNRSIMVSTNQKGGAPSMSGSDEATPDRSIAVHSTIVVSSSTRRQR